MSVQKGKFYSRVSNATRNRDLLNTGRVELGVWQRFRGIGGYLEDRRVVRTELKYSLWPVNQRIVLDKEIISQDYNALGIQKCDEKFSVNNLSRRETDQKGNRTS